jgi:DNA-binding transcriptional MerR regulator
MKMTIKTAAERSGISAHTLRYYDKEGLLPFVDRDNGGARVFKESDFEWLAIIECMKVTGMPIKDIRVFIGLCLAGDATLSQRYEIFLQRRISVKKRIAALEKALTTIEFKCDYYQTAIEAGTEKVHSRDQRLGALAAKAAREKSLEIAKDKIARKDNR